MGDKTQTQLCYHLLVQDPGPVHPGPHLRHVQLLVEGSVLGTELCHTLVELLDAARTKAQVPGSVREHESQGGP